MKKIIILHITAHMGGGVGKVLSGIASYAVSHELSCQHHILLLEQPEKMNFIVPQPVLMREPMKVITMISGARKVWIV